MFNLNDNLKNKKFLIYGYGKSGNASFKYLKKKIKFQFMMIIKKKKSFYFNKKIK